MNLKNETIELLHKNGKTEKDVRWVGTTEFTIPVHLFWKLADQKYDSGYGAQEVAKDLIVVGDEFWLERNDYDGAEWWEYKEFPHMSLEMREIETLIGREPIYWWCTLGQMNERKNEQEK